MTGLLELVEELVFKFMSRDFQEESVKIEVVSDGLKIFLEESYVELMKGSEYTVPRWMASRLESMNVCRVKEPDVTVEKLSQIVYLEETQSKKPQLTKLNGYFYNRLKQVISKLEESLRTSPDWRAQAETLKSYSEFYDALTRERITKIINLLNLMDIPQDISEKMSEEEKQLYLDLKTILNLHLKNLRMRGKHGGSILKG